MFNEPMVSSGMWAIIEAGCDIRATVHADEERIVSFNFGGQRDYVALSFDEDAVNRLIEKATESRDRLREIPQTVVEDDEPEDQ
jgi:hypothetical protein